MKQVDLGFHLIDRAAIEATRKTIAATLAYRDRLPASPDNPITVLARLKKRTMKASPNMAGLLF
ncbi:MAG: hypothetical protein WAW37_14710 [Syntrophobacteraceae bacterium]